MMKHYKKKESLSESSNIYLMFSLAGELFN